MYLQLGQAAKCPVRTRIQFLLQSRRSQQCRRRCPILRRIEELWTERTRLDGVRTSILFSRGLSHSGLSSSKATKRGTYQLSAKLSKPRLNLLREKELNQLPRMGILALLYGLT